MVAKTMKALTLEMVLYTLSIYGKTINCINCFHDEFATATLSVVLLVDHTKMSDFLSLSHGTDWDYIPDREFVPSY